ncbi:MAG TPA: cobalamin-binding protein [Bryobacteraceae bacterium]|nr:cobalamin-binding protein [Bryobacteraceae bacterium]
MKIVSLLPSATEIVCALGLGDALVGVTHECDYPPFVSDLPKVTRTRIPADVSSGEIDRMVREQRQSGHALYTLDLATLERLEPDLILTQALCGVCAVAEEEVQAAACRLPGRPRVINLEPRRFADVLASIRLVAEAAGVDSRAGELIARLESRVDAVRDRTRRVRSRRRVAFLEWLEPPFCSGHWTPELVEWAGGVDVLGRAGQPSRMVGWDEVLAGEPELVFIACCGFGVERTLQDVMRLKEVPEWRRLAIVGAGRVYVTDGSQYFSRPGPRLVDSLEILAHALDPDLHPLPEGMNSLVEVKWFPSGARASRLPDFVTVRVE